MASTAILSPMANPFVYEDLVSRIITMQTQINQINQIIDEHSKNDKIIQRQLAARSFVFIDPFGNRMKNRYVDHWAIHKVVQKLKRGFCPKYLQPWVQIGLIKNHGVCPLDENQLKQTVSEYSNEQEFVAFGKIKILMVNERCQLLQEFFRNALLNDTLKKIEMEIRNIRDQIKKKPDSITKLEIRLCQSNLSDASNEHHWVQGKVCPMDETVFSNRLYETNLWIMARVVEIE